MTDTTNETTTDAVTAATTALTDWLAGTPTTQTTAREGNTTATAFAFDGAVILTIDRGDTSIFSTALSLTEARTIATSH